MHTVITYSIAGSRLAGLSLKSATEEHERQEDFQTWADSLVRSAPRKRRRRTGAKASWECGCKKSRTEKKHKVDSARHVHDEQDRARRAALARKERKRPGPLKFPIWGSSKRVRRWKPNAVPDMGLEPMIVSPAAGRHTLTAQQRRSKLSRACPSCRLLPGVRVPNDLAGADARLPRLADGGAGGRGLCAHQDQYEAVRSL